MRTRYWPSWLVKQADLGGDPDLDFERTFAALAYSYIRDKSPRLMNYAVGFQLLDKNEDSTKAFGTFGFRVKNTWMFIPAIFLDGTLKGHEVLYVQSHDLCVPNTEKWVNHLLAQLPGQLGNVEQRDRSELSIRHPEIFPSVYGKFGSDSMKSAAERAFRGLMDKSWAQRVSGSFASVLKHLLETNPRALIKAARDWYTLYPAVKQAFDDLLGGSFFSDKLSRLMRTIRSSMDSLLGSEPLEIVAMPSGCGCEAPRKPRVVSVTLSMTISKNKPGDQLLSDADLDQADAKIKEQVQNLARQLVGDPDGVVVICDERNGKTAQAYEIQEEVKIQNPMSSGVATMFTGPDELERVVLFLGPLSLISRQPRSGVPGLVVAVSLADSKRWTVARTSEVCLLDRPSVGEEYAAFFQRLADDVTVTGEDDAILTNRADLYLAVGPSGESFGPFIPVCRLNDTTIAATLSHYDLISYDGVNGFTESPVSGYYSKITYPEQPLVDGYKEPNRSLVLPKMRLTLRLKSPAKQITQIGNVWHIPASFRFLRLPAQRECLLAWNSGSPDVRRLLLRYGNSVKLGELRRTNTGRFRWTLDQDVRELDRPDMVRHLIEDVNLSEETARTLVRKAASLDTNKAVRVWIKEAYDPYAAQQMIVPAPPPPPMTTMPVGYGGSMPAQPDTTMLQPIPAMASTAAPDPFAPPEQSPVDFSAIQTVQNAAASGNRDVFAVAMLANLIDMSSPTDQVDRSIPDFMGAMDKLGRLLLLIYYHQAEFEDRYGKQDLPELETTVRDTFDMLGKLVLYLKERDASGRTLLDLSVGMPEETTLM